MICVGRGRCNVSVLPLVIGYVLQEHNFKGTMQLIITLDIRIYLL